MIRYLRFPAPAAAGRIGILPSAFNPVTIAHLSLAEKAAEDRSLEAVVFALPRALPHKGFEDCPLEDRAAALEAALAGAPKYHPAVCSGGLMCEIAEEFAQELPEAELHVLCGRDAAERIASWDYGDGPSFSEQLRRFRLIVGSRSGSYCPPPSLAHRIARVELDPGLAAVSSTAVREAIQANRPWEHLTPPGAARVIRERGLYRRR